MIRSMKNRMLPLIAVVLAAVAAACSNSGSGSAGSAAPAPTAPPGGAVIVAQDVKFDRTTLTLPAGAAAPLVLDNRDGAPHNVAITKTDGSKVFTGETFSGPSTRTYEVPALSAGSYGFHCDVHPDMKGTLTVS
jgi:plastocyanin